MLVVIFNIFTYFLKTSRIILNLLLFITLCSMIVYILLFHILIKKIIKTLILQKNNLNIYYNQIKNFDYLEAFHVLYGSKIYELECIPL